jgi:RING finger protein 113A
MEEPIVFKKRGKKNSHKRKKVVIDEGDGSEEETVIIKKKRDNNVTLNSVSSGLSKEEKEKRKKDIVDVSFKSTGLATSNLPSDMGATQTIEIDTDVKNDAVSLLQKQLNMTEEELNSGTYKGSSAYKQYIKKKDNVTGNAATSKIRAGPQRAPTNVRVTCRFDYQPDICKDYKETGYCGYGDSCKFLHDRGDYKSGWQLDREWEEKQKRLANEEEELNNYLIGEDGSDESSDEELPFACLICRKDFVNPIKTKCGHYFCEKCAIENHAKTKKCFACNAYTYGQFNYAKELVEKLKERKKRIEEREKAVQESMKEQNEEWNENNDDKDERTK